MTAKPRPYIHDLKCDREAFVQTKRGRKPLELRKDDGRDYQAGDYLLLRDLYDGQLSGDTCMVYVLYIIRHGERYGDMLAPGCVAMGVLPFRRPRSI